MRYDRDDELISLLEIVRNTDYMPVFRPVDKVTNPSIRRVWKACDRIEELAAMGLMGDRQIPSLYEASVRANDHVVGSLALAIKAMGIPAIRYLVGLLGDNNHHLNVWAAWVLGTVIREDALPFLELAVKEPTKRDSAMVAIWNTRAAGLELTARLLGDDDYALRNTAAVALATWGQLFDNSAKDVSHPGIDVLLRELHNANPQYSEAAAFGLGYRGGLALDQAMMNLPLLGTVRELQWDDQDNALLLANLLYDESGIVSADPNVRVNAAVHAGEQGNPVAIPVLLRHLRSEKDDTARGAIFWAIWRLANSD